MDPLSGPEDQQNGDPSTVTKAKKTKYGRYTRDITKAEIESYFHLPAEEACVKLGVGLTILKRLCRSFGIHRWPYRRIKCQQRLETAKEMVNGGALDGAGNNYPNAIMPQTNQANRPQRKSAKRVLDILDQDNDQYDVDPTTNLASRRKTTHPDTNINNNNDDKVLSILNALQTQPSQALLPIPPGSLPFPYINNQSSLFPPLPHGSLMNDDNPFAIAAAAAIAAVAADNDLHGRTNDDGAMKLLLESFPAPSQQQLLSPTPPHQQDISMNIHRPVAKTAHHHHHGHHAHANGHAAAMNGAVAHTAAIQQTLPPVAVVAGQGIAAPHHHNDPLHPHHHLHHTNNTINSGALFDIDPSQLDPSDIVRALISRLKSSQDPSSQLSPSIQLHGNLNPAFSSPMRALSIPPATSGTLFADKQFGFMAYGATASKKVAAAAAAAAVDSVEQRLGSNDQTHDNNGTVGVGNGVQTSRPSSSSMLAQKQHDAALLTDSGEQQQQQNQQQQLSDVNDGSVHQKQTDNAHQLDNKKEQQQPKSNTSTLLPPANSMSLSNDSEFQNMLIHLASLYANDSDPVKSLLSHALLEFSSANNNNNNNGNTTNNNVNLMGRMTSVGLPHLNPTMKSANTNNNATAGNNNNNNNNGHGHARLQSMQLTKDLVEMLRGDNGRY